VQTKFATSTTIKAKNENRATENVIKQFWFMVMYEVLKLPGQIGKKGEIRQIREDAQIGNVAPDIQKHFGYRSDKMVKAVLEENHVTSLEKLREKIGSK
jgi:hypothetical protein